VVRVKARVHKNLVTVVGHAAAIAAGKLPIVFDYLRYQPDVIASATLRKGVRSTKR
jgi:hypothetical protein